MRPARGGPSPGVWPFGHSLKSPHHPPTGHRGCTQWPTSEVLVHSADLSNPPLSPYVDPEAGLPSEAQAGSPGVAGPRAHVSATVCVPATWNKTAGSPRASKSQDGLGPGPAVTGRASSTLSSHSGRVGRLRAFVPVSGALQSHQWFDYSRQAAQG